MSYNNDEQARRAQAARNAQWTSNSSQPQNLAPYQTGGYANLNEPTIHTAGTVPMNLLNSPSSHSVIPDVPHNPAPLPLTYQSPIRQQESNRTVLENTTYDQGGSSRGPPDVGYGAQPRSYYTQPAESYAQPTGSYAQSTGYYGQAPQNPGLGPSGSSQRPPDVGYGAQPPNYYGQAPQNPGPGPSGSQIVQTNPSGPSYNPEGPQVISYRGKKTDLERERLRNNLCPAGCGRPLVRGKMNCQECLTAKAQRMKDYRRKVKEEEGK